MQASGLPPPLPPPPAGEMSQMKLTKWHAYAPTTPVTTPPPTPSMLPPLQLIPKPAPLLPSLVPGSLLRLLMDQPSRTMEAVNPQITLLPPQHMLPVPSPMGFPREEERKRLHSSGLMCLVEAAVRAPGPADQDAFDNIGDPKRQKRMDRTDIGSFIHVYNPMEATRRGRPRGRPFAKAAEHARRAKASQIKSQDLADQHGVTSSLLRVELTSQPRSESETAA